MVDVDHPCIESVQTLLLLSQAFLGYGLGKKAYMTFCMFLLSVVTLGCVGELLTGQQTALRWSSPWIYTVNRQQKSRWQTGSCEGVSSGPRISRTGS